MKTSLFVIERYNGNGEFLYWTCSSEHGSGWNPRYPKQAWSRSELANEIRLMIERGTFTDCTIRELSLARWDTDRLKADVEKFGKLVVAS